MDSISRLFVNTTYLVLFDILCPFYHSCLYVWNQRSLHLYICETILRGVKNWHVFLCTHCTHWYHHRHKHLLIITPSLELLLGDSFNFTYNLNNTINSTTLPNYSPIDPNCSLCITFTACIVDLLSSHNNTLQFNNLVIKTLCIACITKQSSLVISSPIHFTFYPSYRYGP